MLLRSLVTCAWVAATLCKSVDVPPENSGTRSKLGAEAVPLEDEFRAPEYLTLESFPTTLLDTITLVEFFSPYCHHCTKLAPIWAEAQKEVATKHKNLNVNMRQVDCVAQGDLCTAQDIQYYPQMRLYIPATDSVTGKKKYELAGKFPPTLRPTRENIVKYITNVADEYELGELNTHSSSKNLDSNALENISAGKIKEPYFVAFFPATNAEWQNTGAGDDFTVNPFSNVCKNCLEARLVWGRILNQVSARVDVGHVMCNSEEALCDSLDMFPRKGYSQRPRFFVYLPQPMSIPPIEYTGPLMVKEMRRFIGRIADNLKCPPTNLKSLMLSMDYILDLPASSTPIENPLSNRVAVVYNKQKLGGDDFKVLARLLNFVSQSPFEVYLHTSSDEMLTKDMEVRARNLAERVQRNPLDPKSNFDEQLFHATTKSTGPSILIYHDNSLVNTVLQNFDLDNINEATFDLFLKANQFPLIQELSPSLVPEYFSEEKKEKSKKIVLTFVNSNITEGFQDSVSKYRLAATQYHYEKQKYIWENLRNQSPELALIDFASGDNTSVNTMKILQESVPDLYQHDDTLFTFIDLANADQFSPYEEWAGFVEGAKAGDTIILSKDSRYMWDSTTDGELLTIEPMVIAQALVKLHSGKKSGLRRKIVGSPFGNRFPPLDYIHDRGFWGYSTLFALVAGVYLASAKINRRRRMRTLRESNVGLLGTFDIAKKD